MLAACTRTVMTSGRPSCKAPALDSDSAARDSRSVYLRVPTTTTITTTTTTQVGAEP